MQFWYKWQICISETRFLLPSTEVFVFPHQFGYFINFLSCSRLRSVLFTCKGSNSITCIRHEGLFKLVNDLIPKYFFTRKVKQLFKSAFLHSFTVCYSQRLFHLLSINLSLLALSDLVKKYIEVHLYFDFKIKNFCPFLLWMNVRICNCRKYISSK